MGGEHSCGRLASAAVLSVAALEHDGESQWSEPEYQYSVSASISSRVWIRCDWICLGQVTNLSRSLIRRGSSLRCVLSARALYPRTAANVKAEQRTMVAGREIVYRDRQQRQLERQPPTRSRGAGPVVRVNRDPTRAMHPCMCAV